MKTTIRMLFATVALAMFVLAPLACASDEPAAPDLDALSSVVKDLGPKAPATPAVKTPVVQVSDDTPTMSPSPPPTFIRVYQKKSNPTLGERIYHRRCYRDRSHALSSRQLLFDDARRRAAATYLLGDARRHPARE